ncbi:MAG: FAD-binding oxidoreductase [Acidimicrobiia bacterium]|nr:FAD-binding oxidoreductase [Acidimicrobiia bacterium]
MSPGALDDLDGRSVVLSGWGRTAPSRATIYRPRHATDVERFLAGAGAATIARGLGRSYGDAAQSGGGHVLDMTSMTDVEELDVGAGTVTVGAGASLDALLRAFVPRGWFVPVSPGTRFVTVGGAIAADIHGKNHHRDGGFCDHVAAFDLLTPDGRRRRVDPTGDPETFGATAGGMGLTGVVLGATLRLLPVETSSVRVDTERATDLDDAMARMERGDHRYRYSVAWIDCLASGRRLGRGVLTRGDHATLDELPAAKRSSARAFAPRHLVTAPRWVPQGVLNRASAAAFNELWFRKAPRQETGRLQTLQSFFHPLDAVGEWNRLWGPAGFIQYQFVVPFGAEAVVRQVLERLSAAHVPSFLAVLKRFGPGRGLLSFPLAGWTLALDIGASVPGLRPLLDGLDELVAGASGRVYLAKDSRLRPDVLQAMYPALDEWRAIRARLDPAGVMRSDLAGRLGLT